MATIADLQTESGHEGRRLVLKIGAQDGISVEHKTRSCLSTQNPQRCGEDLHSSTLSVMGT
jgi:hypothetical protein